MTLSRSVLLGALIVLGACTRVRVPSPLRSALTGKDGAKTIAAATTEVVNTYATLASPAAVGDTSVVVADATGFAANDLILIVASQGAAIDTPNTDGYGEVNDLGASGLNEMWTLSAVDQATGTLTLDLGCGLTGLQNAYPLASNTQIIRVPQYSTLNVLAGATLTGSPWNGTVGGYVVVHVESDATVDGTIDATGLGLRGGAVSLGTSSLASDVIDYLATTAIGGEKGESIAGSTTTYDGLGGRYGRGAPANGGGGGNGLLAGGGGGAGFTAANASAYSGQGTMLASVTGGAMAWALDPGDATSGGPGAGRGGYTLSGVDQEATTDGPNNADWMGNGRLERGGLGGHPITTGARLVLGGGGGAGDFNDVALPANVAGANGGGVVYLIAETLSGGGAIHADGQTGRTGAIVGTGDVSTVATGGGAGGGGGGGIVLLRATGTPSIVATARGGDGGAVTVTDAAPLMIASGPGGGGSGGAVGTYTGLTLMAAPITTAGLGGITDGVALKEFPSNGASAGESGLTAASIPQASPPTPACLPADVQITLTDSADPVDTGAGYSYTATVLNNGPNAAYDLSASITLPAGVTPGTITAAGWSCTQAGQVLTCTRAILLNTESSTIALAVTAPSTAATINTTATIMSREDPAVANNSDTESTVIQHPMADLALTQTAPSASASGERYRYSFTVTNNGPRDAPSVKIVDVLPSGVTYVSASGTGWTCVAAASTVTCTHAALTNGTMTSVDLTVSAPALTTASTLDNTGTVSINAAANPSGTIDSTSSNDSAMVSTTITPVDLSITKIDLMDPVAAGSTITYTITVTNPASVAAHAIVVNDPLPSGTTFVSASGTGWTCMLVTTKVQCTLPVIAAAPATTPSITIVLGAPNVASSISNTATVSATATDPNNGNNSDTEQTTVSPPAPGSADLSVTVDDTPDPVSIGGALTFTVHVSNAGPDPAAGAQIVTPLPAGATFVSASGTGWTCSQAGSTVTCQHTGNIAVGAAAPITIVIDAPPTPGMLSTAFVITATTPDPAVGNNSAIATTMVVDPTAINQPPVLTLPTSLSTLENSPLALDGSNAPRVDDPDAMDAVVELRVTGMGCVLTLADSMNLDFIVGDGILDPDLTVRGTLVDLNVALSGAIATPDPSFFGTANLIFTVDDLGNTGAGGPQSTVGTLSFLVIPVDQPPRAVTDEITVLTNSSNTRIDVLANDSAGQGGHALSIVAVGSASQGVAVLSDDGAAVIYTPNAGYIGDDGFTYTISNGNSQVMGQVIVHVKGIDVPTNGVSLGGGGVGCAMAGTGTTSPLFAALVLMMLSLVSRAKRRRR